MLFRSGGLSTNLGAILSVEHYTAVFAGETKLGNTLVKIVKLIPLDENSDVVITTLYIDESNLLIRKASTTTRDNGTFESELTYGKWSDWGLPDKVVFSFNTKNYKLPKGITFEYEGGEQPKPTEDMKNKKGKIEIIYNSYTINQGLGRRRISINQLQCIWEINRRCFHPQFFHLLHWPPQQKTFS